MIKLIRAKPPAWLQSKWFEWGKRWARRLEKDKKAQFTWATYQGQKVHRRLLPLLLQMSQEHCAFCDAFPMPGTVAATIEHFKPKSAYPLEAYAWDNLFPCCHNCQQKNDAYATDLLKPDAPTYEFYDYFVFNYSNGELEPNPAASAADQRRAELTIDLYRLNANNKPSARLQALAPYEQALNSGAISLDECPYRFMFV